MPNRHFYRIFLLVLLLAACGREEVAPTPIILPTATATARPLLPSPTATTPPPTATSTSTPEPIQPAVVAHDQVLGDDGLLVIDRVTAVSDGWLVIHGDDNGAVGPVLGYAPVTAGDNEQVQVTIDPLQASPTLYAMLHTDVGTIGRYEFPGVDAPVQVDGAALSAGFAIEVEALLPTIIVADQDLDYETVVGVQAVIALVPSWLIIHADEEGVPGPVIGQRLVPAGESYDLAIPIDRYRATPRLHAMLYEDTGESGRFEYPAADPPILVNSRAVVSFFNVTMPPDVLVYDQPVIDDQIIIDRVISYGPGWIVIYADDEGQIGLIVGQAHLEDGVNEQVAVPVFAAAVTPLVHAVIHNDTGEINAFEFPARDPQARYENRLQPFPFRTDVGNFIVVRDQPLGAGGEVILSQVVVNTPAWAIIHNDRDGEPGEPIGQLLLPAGYHLGLPVMIDEEAITETLHVVLHQDAGAAGTFEFPGADAILIQRNREIRISFTLLSEQ